MAGLAGAAVFLMLCFGFYKRLKKSSLDENQSPTKQKLIILLRIGVFWGFWWCVGGLLLLFLMMYFKLDAFIDITMNTLTTLGWIIIPAYVFYCGYQLFYNKKTINDFNMKAIQAIKEEEEESVFVNIFSYIIVIIIIGFGFYYYNKKNTKGELEIFDYGSGTSEETIDIYKYPYEDEKEWLTNDIACQNLEEEKNKYYCIVIKDQCAEESLKEKYGEARLLFDVGHFSLEPTTFEKCANQLREKFKIGILPFDEELKNFQTFIFGTRSETSDTIDLPSSSLEFKKLQQLRNKPQDITGDRIRTFVIKILSSASETNEGNLEKVWSEVESELTEVINTIIKSSYDIDDVITNGFGKTRVPFYTQALVNKFKKVKISYSTEDLTEMQLIELMQKELDATESMKKK